MILMADKFKLKINVWRFINCFLKVDKCWNHNTKARFLPLYLIIVLENTRLRQTTEKLQSDESEECRASPVRCYCRGTGPGNGGQWCCHCSAGETRTRQPLSSLGCSYILSSCHYVNTLYYVVHWHSSGVIQISPETRLRTTLLLTAPLTRRRHNYPCGENCFGFQGKLADKLPAVLSSGSSGLKVWEVGDRQKGRSRTCVKSRTSRQCNYSVQSLSVSLLHLTR